MLKWISIAAYGGVWVRIPMHCHIMKCIVGCDTVRCCGWLPSLFSESWLYLHCQLPWLWRQRVSLQLFVITHNIAWYLDPKDHSRIHSDPIRFHTFCVLVMSGCNLFCPHISNYFLLSVRCTAQEYTGIWLYIRASQPFTFISTPTDQVGWGGNGFMFGRLPVRVSTGTQTVLATLFPWVFPVPPRKYPVGYLKLRHDRFILHPFVFIIRRCITGVTKPTVHRSHI
jgi:hypothetical protein